MLVNKKSLENKYVPDSYHIYAIPKINISFSNKHYPSLSTEGKLELISSIWVAYLDRLAHAEFDVSEVWNSFEHIIETINRTYLPACRFLAESIRAQRNISEQDLARLAAFEEISAMNEKNVQQRDLLQEDDQEHFPELFILSQDFFKRLIRIKQLLLIEAGIDAQPFINSVQSMADANEKVAERMDYLALRHFHWAFTSGKYQTLTAICTASAFIKDINRILFAYIIGEDDNPVTLEIRQTCFDTEYNINLLCWFDQDFNFYYFDDETNPIHPDVVDLMFSEN